MSKSADRVGTRRSGACATGAILGFMSAGAVSRRLAMSAALWWLRRPTTRAAEPQPFIILLPVLREQSKVQETLMYFTNLDYPPELYRIVVATTAREENDRAALDLNLNKFVEAMWRAPKDASPSDFLTGHLPRADVARLLEARDTLSRTEFANAVFAAFRSLSTTAELVDEFAAMSPRVSRIHAPIEFARKAGQLRYSFDHLDSALKGWPALDRCRYVGIYDFDARPEPRALWAVSEAAATSAVVLQQPGITVAPGGAEGSSAFAVMDGQLHARLGLRVELWSLLADRYLRRAGAAGVALRSSIHSVGNGLFLDRFELKRLGGIPPVVDDLAIGWRAAAAGLPIEPVRSPVFYDAYQSRTQAGQSRRFICSGYLRALKDIEETPDKLGWVVPIHLAKIHYRLLQWTAGPMLRCAALIACVRTKPRSTLLTMGFLYAMFIADIMSVRRFWAQSKSTPRQPRWARLATVLASPCALATYGSGARRALVDRARGANDPSFAKTER